MKFWEKLLTFVFVAAVIVVFLGGVSYATKNGHQVGHDLSMELGVGSKVTVSYANPQREEELSVTIVSRDTFLLKVDGEYIDSTRAEGGAPYGYTSSLVLRPGTVVVVEKCSTDVYIKVVNADNPVELTATNQVGQVGTSEFTMFITFLLLAVWLFVSFVVLW